MARKFAARGSKGAHATVVALVGDLGSGKTTFIKGFARGLGIKDVITSPTFVIFRNYPVAHHASGTNGYGFFCHMDAYRIRKIKELASVGMEKIMKDPKYIMLIEWADKIRKTLPRNTTLVRFDYGIKERERMIETGGCWPTK